MSFGSSSRFELMATILLAEAVRGTIPWTDLVHMNAGPARNFDFEVICSNWMTTNGTLWFYLERSLDNKVTWVGFSSTDKTCGSLGKGTTQAQQIQNAKRFGIFWDGQAMDVRGRVDVTPAPFAWGLLQL